MQLPELDGDIVAVRVDELQYDLPEHPLARKCQRADCTRFAPVAGLAASAADTAPICPPATPSAATPTAAAAAEPPPPTAVTTGSTTAPL